MNKTVSACTLGCKVNQYDTNAMLERLAAAGFSVVPWGGQADVYLINTCTVTNTADKKSRNLIRRAVRKQPDAAVCVCGCMAQNMAGELLKDGVAAVIGTEDRAKIVKIVEESLRGKRQNAVRDVSKETCYEELSVTTSGEKTRGYVKIQEGCNSFCSYCIIPYVRGRIRSRDAESVLREAEALAQNGVKEIVLTGIHISSYGQDNGESLLRLLEKLDGVGGILRIRLGSLEPHILTDALVQKLSAIKKVCPHFHVSMQSGSTSVLKRMNRKYTVEEYAVHLETVRRYYDAPAITTDIITGFPGESEAEFKETFAFTERMSFSRIHVFPYSERKGTPAAEMDGRVPVAVRKERARVLIELGGKLEQEYMEQFIDTRQIVLFEEKHIGYTDRYVRVCAKNAVEGECEIVLLRGVENGMMMGEIEQ